MSVDGGFYFVADETGEFLTSEFFRVDSNIDHCYGRLVVRKHVVDTVQSGTLHERSGFMFQLFNTDASTPVGAVFETDSTGRGVSEPVPFGTYILRELNVPSTMQPPTDTTIVVDRRRTAPVEITNITLPGSPYGR